MPSHPDRARSAPLPEGYQFGDGAVAGGAGLPERPIVDGAFDQFFCVVLQDGTESIVSAGIAELARALSNGTFSAYARLERPQLAEDARFYGPVRYIKFYNSFPRDGHPRMMHMLHVGVVGWVPTPKPFIAGRDLGDEA